MSIRQFKTRARWSRGSRLLEFEVDQDVRVFELSFLPSRPLHLLCDSPPPFELPPSLISHTLSAYASTSNSQPCLEVLSFESLTFFHIIVRCYVVRVPLIIIGTLLQHIAITLRRYAAVRSCFPCLPASTSVSAADVVARVGCRGVCLISGGDLGLCAWT